MPATPDTAAMGNSPLSGGSNTNYGMDGASLTQTDKVQAKMTQMVDQHRLHIKMFRQRQSEHFQAAKEAFARRDLVFARQEFVSYKQLATQIQSVQNAVNAVQRQQNTLYQQTLNDETMAIMRTAARVNARKPMATLDTAIEMADNAAEVAELTCDMASALADSNVGNAAEDEAWEAFCKLLDGSSSESAASRPTGTLEVAKPPEPAPAVDVYGLPSAPEAALPEYSGPPSHKDGSPPPTSFALLN